MPFSHCKIKSRIPHYIWLLCFLNFFQFMILLQSRLPRPRHVEKYFGERLSTWLCLMLPHARKRLCSTLLCSGAVTAMGWRGDLIIGVNGETTMLLIWTRRKIVYQWYLRERKKKKEATCCWEDTQCAFSVQPSGVCDVALWYWWYLIIWLSWYLSVSMWSYYLPFKQYFIIKQVIKGLGNPGNTSCHFVTLNMVNRFWFSSANEVYQS